MHGTADNDVEVELGMELAEYIKSSRLEKIEGVDHRYTREEDFKKMIALISDFIIDNINAPKQKASEW